MNKKACHVYRGHLLITSSEPSRLDLWSQIPLLESAIGRHVQTSQHSALWMHMGGGGCGEMWHAQKPRSRFLQELYPPAHLGLPHVCIGPGCRESLHELSQSPMLATATKQVKNTVRLHPLDSPRGAYRQRNAPTNGSVNFFIFRTSLLCSSI
jgi:hypothetical protein